MVAQGRVFVTDALLQKPSVKEFVHCFEEATGKPLWTFAYDVTYSEWVWVPSQTSGPPRRQLSTRARFTRWY